MKKLLILLLFIPCVAFTQTYLTEISVDQVEGLISGDSIISNGNIKFHIRYSNQASSNITGFVNAYRLWTHRNGEYTDNFEAADFLYLHTYTDAMNGFDGGLFVGTFSWDGNGADTIKFGGFTLFGPGFPSGLSAIAYMISTSGLMPGDTLCIDSSWAPPGGIWNWSTSSSGNQIPHWSGPYCYHVSEQTTCCIDNRGDVNLDGEVTISDLMAVVGYLFPPHDLLPCANSGNIDGKFSNGLPMTISDVTYFVDYMFFNGPPPADCP